MTKIIEPMGNFSTVKECSKTLGISKMFTKTLISKDLVCWDMIGGSYVVDVYDVFHYIDKKNTSATKQQYFLNRLMTEILSELDDDIEKYNSINSLEIDKPTVLKKFLNKEYYCEFYDIKDLLKKDNVNELLKLYYQLDFEKNKSNPNKHYRAIFEISKKLDLKKSIDYKLSIIFDYFGCIDWVKTERDINSRLNREINLKNGMEKLFFDLVNLVVEQR